MIPVLIADDQPLVRGGLRVILEAQEDLEVVGEAEHGGEAVEPALRLRPDVIAMDIRMPRVDGIEARRRLVGQSFPARVLVLTTFDLDEHVYEALRTGAAGGMLEDAPPARLVDAVRTVARGEALLAPAVTRRLVERFVAGPSRGAPDAATFGELTPRELDVVRLVARGLSNAEIGADLFLSEATVKTHVTSILRKLDLRDRTQVVVRPGAG